MNLQGIAHQLSSRFFIKKLIKFKPEDKKVEEARTDISEIIPIVQTVRWKLRKEGIYIALMVRRLILTRLGIFKDDMDFIGNKRFELAV